MHNGARIPHVRLRGGVLFYIDLFFLRHWHRAVHGGIMFVICLFLAFRAVSHLNIFVYYILVWSNKSVTFVARYIESCSFCSFQLIYCPSLREQALKHSRHVFFCLNAVFFCLNFDMLLMNNDCSGIRDDKLILLVPLEIRNHDVQYTFQILKKIRNSFPNIHIYISVSFFLNTRYIYIIHASWLMFGQNNLGRP